MSLGSIGCYRVGGCTERLSSEPFHHAPCCTTGVILFPIPTASRWCLPRSRRGSLNRRRIVSSEWSQSRFHPRHDRYTVFLRVKTDNSRGLEIRDTCLLEIDKFFTHPPRSAPPRSLRERGQPFFYKPACRLYSNYISFVRALVFRRIHWGPPPWIIKIDLCGD